MSHPSHNCFSLFWLRRSHERSIYAEKGFEMEEIAGSAQIFKVLRLEFADNCLKRVYHQKSISLVNFSLHEAQFPSCFFLVMLIYLPL